MEFCRCKERVRKQKKLSEELGDSWTFIAVERHTKFVLAFQIGKRDLPACQEFLNKLDRVVDGRFQMSTDGLTMYKHNVPYALGSRVDFGMLIKKYKSEQVETRYSPAQIISAEKRTVFGSPDPANICTSHIERLNLTLRMQMRRFTRLTNGFSKSLDHHRAMQAIFFVWYNWCRKHESIKKTPAMGNGLASEKWTIEKMISEVAI